MLGYISKNKIKISIVVLVVYILSYFLGIIDGIGSYMTQVAYAQSGSTGKVVSVFVEKSLYESRKNNIDWFASDYLGSKISDLDTIIFVYDKNSFGPDDLVKINQNLYLEGNKSSATDMLGTIFIGDIPLPLVNKNGFIFQTIYPLVDFVDAKFAFDPKLDLFDYQGEGNSQPEIWHSVINFGSELDKYDNYFDKIRTYADDPTSILGSGLWYDDIVYQKKTFDPDSVQNYINNYIFTEDISYNRYTNLMVDVFNFLHNSGTSELFSSYASNQQDILNQLSQEEYYNVDEFEEVKTQYQQNIQKFWDLIKKLKSLLGSNNANTPDASDSALGTLPDSRFINTLFLQSTVEGFLKYYIDLYGSSYYDKKEKNIQIGGWSSADDHMTKLTKVDEFTKQKIIDYNDKLEIALDNKIDIEEYDMNVVIPTTIEKGQCKRNGPDPKKGYEVYYFGKPAEEVQNAQDFGIYRGTYLNLRSLGGLQNYDISTSLDYSQNQSLGGTRGENNREVEAHRGYNFSLVEYDQQEFERLKKMVPYRSWRKKFRDNIEAFVTYYRNGFTPLNIDPDVTGDIRLDIDNMDFKNLRNPRLDRSIGGSVFDIAGSRLTTPARVVGMSFGVDDEDDDNGGDGNEDTLDISEMSSIAGYSDSYEGMFQFASAIQVTRGKLFGDGQKRVRVTKAKIFRGKPRKLARITDEQFPYYDIFNGGNWTYNGIFFFPEWYGDYIPMRGYCMSSDQNNYEYIRYKSVSSIFEHKSPTFEEMFGEYIYLENYQGEQPYYCSPSTQEPKQGMCRGMQINLQQIAGYGLDGLDPDYDIYIGEDKYAISDNGIIYFNDGLDFSYQNLDISLSNLNGIFTGTNNNQILVYNFQNFDDEGNVGDLTFDYTNATFDCELEEQTQYFPGICYGIKFQINNRDYHIDEAYYTIDHTGKNIRFFPGATVNVMNKEYDLGGYIGNIVGNTIVRSGGKSLQIGGVNEMTIDRPVDSPKYINFQGIGGSKVTFVYPNFYKVEVFKNQGDKKILKTIPEIEESVRSYLREKVSDYNKSLKEQYDNRLVLYNHQDHFYYPEYNWKDGVGVGGKKNLMEELTKMDYKVSPLVEGDTGLYKTLSGYQLRSYKYMDQDFLIDSLASTEITSDDAISIIARDLYYQNIMRSELPDMMYESALDVIGNIVGFNDINNKVRYIYENYTTTYDDDVVEDISLYNYALPEYNGDGYAVGYINSDGDDFVTYETLPPILKYIDTQKTVSSNIKPKVTNDNEQCGSVIPPSYQVPLSKWPDAFKCRWENIDGRKVQLKFSSKLVDYFASGGAEEWKEDWTNTTSDFGESRSQYSSHRSQLLKKEDPDLTPEQKQNLIKKLNSISYVFDSKQIPLDQTVTLKLYSNIDLGQVDMKISSSGDNCLVRLDNNTDLCNTTSEIRRDPYDQTYELSFKFRNNISAGDGIGVSNVQFAICEGKCVYKNIQLYINPGNINKFRFDTPFGDGVNVAQGSQIPVFLRGYDLYNNEIGTTLYDFNITTRGEGVFLFEGSSVESINTNSFPTAFLYDTNKSSIGNEIIEVKPSDFFDDLLTDLPQQSYSINIIEPVINTNASDISFKLPDDPNYYYNISDTSTSYDPDLLPKIRLHINQLGSDVYANISIKSVGGLVVPHILTNGGLTPLKDLIYTGVQQTIYLVPTYLAGKDVLQIQIGDTIRNIPIDITPGNPKKTTILLDRSNMQIGDIIRSTLLVTDIWGNKVNIPTQINFGMYGNISSNGLGGPTNKIDVQDGSIDIDIKGESNGGIGYIFATIEGVDLSEQYPDYKKILVQNRAWTDSGVNINYLSLFGSSWGVAQQDKNTVPHIATSIANQIISKSSKTLAVTTQLIDAQNIYSTVLAITPTGQLRNFNGKEVSLILQDKGYYIQLEDIGNIYLGSTAGSSIRPLSNLNSVGLDNNTIYYIPETTDSFIYSNLVLGGQIRINDTVVFDISNDFISSDIDIRYIENMVGGDSVREIYYKDVLAGSMIIRLSSNLSNTTLLSSIDNSKYNFGHIDLGDGESWISLWDSDLDMYEYDKQVPSIQDSIDPEYDIGWGDYFKNVSQFSNGKSVGDSTISYSSEYMINFGDPTFSMDDTSQIIPYTQFDGSLGELMYSDPSEVISQTMDIDFDKDGHRDMIVIYNNGKVKLVANNAGHYVEIGDLMYIEDGIKKVYVGDGDGDGYQDIFIHTNSNKLRFYKNYNGASVDVDGYPVCLDVPSGDVGLDGVRERQLTDINNDRVVDILTNDRNNEIKVFLGGGGGVMSPGFAGANYISNDKYGCDPNRLDRQRDSIQIVNSFALELDEQDQVDGSMVHYNAIHIPPVDESIEDIDIGSNDLDLLNEELEGDEGNIDIGFRLPDVGDGKKIDSDKISTAVADGATSTIKPYELLDEYVVSLDNVSYLGSTFKPSSYIGDIENIPYKPIDYINATDTISIVKRYSDVDGDVLEDNDIVKITIQINSRGYAGPITYLEQLVGPFDIDKNFIYHTGFDRGNLPQGATLRLQNTDPYLFMVDDINISQSQTILFSYYVRYKNKQIVTINMGPDHIEKNGDGGSIGLVPKAYAQAPVEDDYLFELLPLDGCVKIKWQYSVPDIGATLQEHIEDLIKQLQEEAEVLQEQFASGFYDMLSDVDNLISDGVLDETWNQEGFMGFIQKVGDQGEALGNLNINTKVKLGISPDIDEKIDKAIQKLTKGLCDGFKIGDTNCSGVPILSNLPFNMSLLTPGDMVVMGQKIFNDKGLPTITFPGNWPCPIGYCPFPGIFGFPFKGTTDGFGYFSMPTKAGPYSSMLRLYVSPTLTAKVGLALCIGPYGVGMKIPKLFREVVGNCIVFAIDPGIGVCKNDTPDTTYTVTPENKQLQDFNTCNDNLSDDTKGPFKLVTKGIDAADNRLEQSYGSRPSLRIQLGGNPNVTSYDSISISDFVQRVKIPDVKPLDMQVRGPTDRGLVACIVNQFVDNQVRYIINNMTSMDVNIVLPDFNYIGNNIVGLKRNNQAQLDYENYYNKQTSGGIDIVKSLTAQENSTRISNYLSLYTSNPIEKLQAFINQSDIMKVHTKDVKIDIPWIYLEDINKLKGTLTAWLKRNSLIIERWKQVGQDIANNCEAVTNQLEKEKCNIQADQILQFTSQLGQFERSIRQNLQVLDEYANFPTELYELIHTYDKYLDSVNSLMYNVVDQLFGWLGKIARGFDAWVEFIISLINILKSWQIIIDFSINWQDKCSKCTVDSYSAYSCTLKGFCPKLPVFNIPPFKIPDITIDLSKIDFRTDIILPRFRFVPKKIDIIDDLLNGGLPDLPYPSDLSILNNQVNLRLPAIPVIPAPPDLDLISLPDFIPTFEFDGPVLPPAPRLPRIAPELGMAIDIADFVGRIFCITKKSVGLVGEKGLKSRIEQITQRTRQVEPWDSVQLLIPKAPLKSYNLFNTTTNQGGNFDINVTPFADIRLSFDGIYALFEGIAEGINETTNKGIEGTEKGIKWIETNITSGTDIGDIFDGVKDVIDSVDDVIDTSTQINIDPFGSNNVGEGNILEDMLTYDDTNSVPYGEYDIINDKIKSDLAYFITQDDDKTRLQVAANVLKSYQYKANASVNYDGINDIVNEVNGILSDEKQKNQTLQEKIRLDWDGFVDDITQNYLSDDELDITFSTNLLDTDKQTMDYISSAGNPYDIFFQTNKVVIDGLVDAIEHENYTTMGISRSDYDQQQQYLHDLKTSSDMINDAISDDKILLADNQIGSDKAGEYDDIYQDNQTILSYNSLTTPVSTNTLLAQGPPSSNPNIVAGADVVDPGLYLDGLFVPGTDGNYHNVISNREKAQKFVNKNFQKDMNRDNKLDIVLWDEHNVYIKYATDSSIIDGGGAADLTIINLDNTFGPDQYGYIGSWKVWSKNHTAKNRDVRGQDYATVTYTFANDLDSYGANDIGYVVRYSDDIYANKSKKDNFRYIVLLSNIREGQDIRDVDMDGHKVSLDDEDVQVVYLDPSKENRDAVLSNISRSWYYASVARLDYKVSVNNFIRFITFGSRNISHMTLGKVSPWSYIKTAGMQIIADDSAPSLVLGLYRREKNEALNLDNYKGYINTYYTLSGYRWDDSKVIKNYVVMGDKIVYSGSDGNFKVPTIFSTKPAIYDILFVGEDPAGNMGQKQVRVEIGLPEIQIDRVDKNTIGQTDIISSLDVDLDTGVVRFINIRNSVPTILKTSLGGNTDFGLSTYQTNVTGGKFGLRNEIGFYDSDGRYLGAKIAGDGELIIENSAITTRVVRDDNVPKLQILKGGSIYYTIYLKPKQIDLSDIRVLDGTYNISTLRSDSNIYGIFEDGYCIQKIGGECQVYINQAGAIYSPTPLNAYLQGEYRYSGGKVYYNISKSSAPMFEIGFEVEPIQ